jgi:hypothetical protein
LKTRCCGKVFGPKSGEAAGGRRKLNFMIRELHNCTLHQIFIKMIKSRTVGLGDHAACMGAMKNIYVAFSQKA